MFTYVLKPIMTIVGFVAAVLSLIVFFQGLESDADESTPPIVVAPSEHKSSNTGTIQVVIHQNSECKCTTEGNCDNNSGAAHVPDKFIKTNLNRVSVERHPDFSAIPLAEKSLLKISKKRYYREKNFKLQQKFSPR